MLTKLLHVVLSFFVPINVAVFYYWPSVSDVPRWMIPSIVITFIQISTINAAVNVNTVWHWEGFFNGQKNYLKWWRRTVYLIFALFMGWIIYEATTAHPDKTIVLNVVKAVFIGINIWYLGFSLMGDESAVSKEMRDAEDHFFDKLVGSITFKRPKKTNLKTKNKNNN